ncbi:hypothetical protein BgiMline_015870 [Biomphalaria glabrata]|nr:hypothetical protein BgiMline_008681 [Biomphalaria glabrata]
MKYAPRSSSTDLNKVFFWGNERISPVTNGYGHPAPTETSVSVLFHKDDFEHPDPTVDGFEHPDPTVDGFEHPDPTEDWVRK